MKVLIICSGNARHISPFTKEQAESISKFGAQVLVLPIVGKGMFGYLKNVPAIRRRIKEFQPDVVHAHYGLSGLAACMQRMAPVVITFHGSDARIPYVRCLSQIASRLSSFNIFVEDKIRERIKGHGKDAVIPCGVNLHEFFPLDKGSARRKLNLQYSGNYVLFASRFDNPVKNYPLALSAISTSGLTVELIELKNRKREEVNLLLNASDMMLLTSLSEGSPQVIKEALACNCPIVATNVGDVEWTLGDIAGCYRSTFDPGNVAENLKQALEFSQRVGKTRGRDRILELGLDSETTARKILAVYNGVLRNSRSFSRLAIKKLFKLFVGM